MQPYSPAHAEGDPDGASSSSEVTTTLIQRNLGRAPPVPQPEGLVNGHIVRLLQKERSAAAAEGPTEQADAHQADGGEADARRTQTKPTSTARRETRTPIMVQDDEEDQHTKATHLTGLDRLAQVKVAVIVFSGKEDDWFDFRFRFLAQIHQLGLTDFR